MMMMLSSSFGVCECPTGREARHPATSTLRSPPPGPLPTLPTHLPAARSAMVPAAVLAFPSRQHRLGTVMKETSTLLSMKRHVNPVAAGFVARGILACNSSPTGVLGGDLAFAVFSVAIDLFLRREPAECVCAGYPCRTLCSSFMPSLEYMDLVFILV